MSLLGRVLGSEENAIGLIRRLGLEPFLTRCVKKLNSLLLRFTKSDRTPPADKP